MERQRQRGKRWASWERVTKGPERTSVYRVIGGQDAAHETYPWEVALLGEGGSLCGGSLIAAEWVLTAAHCVTYELSPQLLPPDQFEIRHAATVRADGRHRGACLRVFGGRAQATRGKWSVASCRVHSGVPLPGNPDCCRPGADGRGVRAERRFAAVAPQGRTPAFHAPERARLLEREWAAGDPKGRRVR